jgi:hypothetical protein
MEIIDCLTEEVLTQILNINSLQELLNYIKKKVEINLLPIYKFPVQILVNSDTYFSYLRESKKIHRNAGCCQCGLKERKDY